MRFSKPTKTRIPTRTVQIEFAPGRFVEVQAAKRKGTRKMILRYRPLSREIILTLPANCSFDEGVRFAQSRTEWLAEHVEQAQQHVPITEGSCVPVLGEVLTVRHAGHGRGVMTREGNELLVYGDTPFINRRVCDWLKKQAEEEIQRIIYLKQPLLPGKAAEVKVRAKVYEMVSQWGSCHTNGMLKFSWRLVFAPQDILEYVVCHELSHLVHMDHSRAYWQIVATLCPDYKPRRSWLKEQGNTLFHYG